ncbi:hypothetical protein, partial [Vibrio sp. 10N.261.45.E1]|uniref:hypothetical protein n=1 Tax=Vibrio sp. 10N.261.45.E1 TaxID=1903177 RepID=UPI001C2BF1C9
NSRAFLRLEFDKKSLVFKISRYLAISLSRYLAISLSRYLAISLSRYLAISYIQKRLALYQFR